MSRVTCSPGRVQTGSEGLGSPNFLSEKKLNVLVFFFSFGSFLSAQIIHVVDSKSGESIENVAIFSIDKTKSVITHYNGKASVDEFNLTNYFHHHCMETFLMNNIKFLIVPLTF